jgi:hypothetical protein
MSRRRQNRYLAAVLLAIPLLFVAITGLQMRIDAQARLAQSPSEELLFTSGHVLKKISLGYDSLLADIYWTRTIQYFGPKIGDPHAKFDLLFPLLDVTTTLDPNLIAAYHFGAIFLSEPSPIGAGRTDLAIQLVKRGIAENRQDWALYSDLGFLYYWRLKDYKNASQTYLEGSKIPASPVWLRLMAARIAEEGGSTETSRIIWTEMYKTTNDPSIRAWIFKQLEGLRAVEDEDHLNDLLQLYRKRFSRNPYSFRDLIDAGLLGGIPVDPAGYPYVVGKDSKAHVGPGSPVVEPK